MVTPQEQNSRWRRHRTSSIEFPCRGKGRLHAAGCFCGRGAPSRAADEWPTRDITFHEPWAPGGSTDPISRKYAELLEKQLKVKIIVEKY
jgi:tripartite-type tricarboxylate transporter receptor subunit TctC